MDQSYREKIVEHLLTTPLHEDYAERIERYMKDPLAVIHYLFWKERDRIKIKLENMRTISNFGNPVFPADMKFYYDSKLIKEFKILNKPTHGFGTSLNTYLDIAEWYHRNKKESSQIIIPIEFPFGEELGVMRGFYDFKLGELPIDVEEELHEGVKFLKEKGRLSSWRTEIWENVEMSPPAKIIIDFEYESSGP